MIGNDLKNLSFFESTGDLFVKKYEEKVCDYLFADFDLTNDGNSVFIVCAHARRIFNRNLNSPNLLYVEKQGI